MCSLNEYDIIQSVNKWASLMKHLFLPLFSLIFKRFEGIKMLVGKVLTKKQTNKQKTASRGVQNNKMKVSFLDAVINLKIF